MTKIKAEESEPYSLRIDADLKKELDAFHAKNAHLARVTIGKTDLAFSDSVRRLLRAGLASEVRRVDEQIARGG